MSMILWPCLQYHNLLKKLYMKFEPLFMKLDYSMKVKNKWRYEGGTVKDLSISIQIKSFRKKHKH